MDFIPQEDGITHLNVYSGARTSLGVFLSNFISFSIDTVDGEFESIEGYWYWLCIPESTEGRDKLRSLAGLEAKKYGRQLRGEADPSMYSDEFKEKIKKATTTKILASSFKDMFINSTLPFKHYYFIRGKIYFSESSNFQIEHLENLRRDLKSGMPVM